MILPYYNKRDEERKNIKMEYNDKESILDAQKKSKFSYSIFAMVCGFISAFFGFIITVVDVIAGNPKGNAMLITFLIMIFFIGVSFICGTIEDR